MDQREGEAALKKPVTFMRLRPEPGEAVQQGDRGDAGRGGGRMFGCLRLIAKLPLD